MAESQIVLGKVQRFTKEIFPQSEIQNNGSVKVVHQSTQVTISVKKFAPANTDKMKEFKVKHDLPSFYVEISATLIADAPRNQALYQWVAVEGQKYPFGGARIVLLDSGKCSIFYQYALSGDTLDSGEIKWAVINAAYIADRLDDELKELFGGARFLDGEEVAE